MPQNDPNNEYIDPDAMARRMFIAAIGGVLTVIIFVVTTVLIPK